MTDAGVRVVLCTAASVADAERIARAVVEERLAACVNPVPGVTSLYRWEGKIERSEEVLLVIKTRADLLDRLRGAIVAVHPYDVPEVVALPVTAGHPPYLDWIRASCEAPSAPGE